ncbi:MAG: hypothetical protein SGJ09_09250 [Phycisphaerae bacterium]|nr:hypothetical protein [Phycisphaerae bacterium]
MATFARTLLGITCLSVVLVACSPPDYDTSTPQKTLDAMQKMVEDERPDLLPTLLEIKARDITFDDGVTEASAIGDVKKKLGETLARLWRVSKKLRERWPQQVEKELALAKAAAIARAAKTAGSSVASASPARNDIGDILSRVFADPFGYITDQRKDLVAEDMSDGTGSISWKGEPLWQGAVTMIETSDGWRLTVPIEFVQQSEYWPQTRHEWAVVAAMMLGIENSLKDFERELDAGTFRDLRQASERVGRLVGESVVVQSIIYASMKQNAPDRPK